MMKTASEPMAKPQVVSLKSHFVSNKIKCAATLYVPSGFPQPLPAILMVHGWGGVQSTLLEPFRRCFNENGFAVMTFDFGGWGESEGTLRNSINPWQRVKDVKSALQYLKSRPEVDANKIVLWGTSFGGGHVIEVAAEHPELLGVIAHVPLLDGLDAVKAVPLSRTLRFGLFAAADLLKPGKPLYIPVIAPAGEFATMDRDGAYDAMQAGTLGEYDNRIAARSVLTMGLYRPFRQIRKIRIPALLVGATKDTVAPFMPRKIANKHSYIHTVTLDSNHFEPYFEPLLSANLDHQMDFLKSIAASATS